MAAASSCNFNWGVNGKGTPEQPCSSPKSSQILFSSNLSFCYSNIRYCLSLRSHQTLLSTRFNETKNSAFVVASAKADPLKIMISGAPASGKGTQCELITKKYGLVHIAAGDLLRAEIASGSENGKRAKEYMEKGQLVPNEIVVMMVKERLLLPDSQENGWLLDGYPRSLLQATALKEFGFQPDLFILLEVRILVAAGMLYYLVASHYLVHEEILVERVVGRRLDPVTGKIYHLKYSPPETEEIAARLTQRFDDTEEKVKLRLQTHHQNVEAVLLMYEDITLKVNGNVPKEDVFAQIDGALTKLHEDRKLI
ncbi:adenylate kinase 2, chloroplastic-like isoform X2 [Populus nigra]|uniref:adenylate kinase 2, chloroplastic-like isoform X2 n=1 Tax=Populus nigra TaxID=3691 RepID=UPI002B26E3E8|nr:adenylate kinase 2, chloroplastic-like isoform X2 [Populus nigra]